MSESMHRPEDCEGIGLTLVAHYGQKSSAFQAWLRAAQAQLAELGDAFEPYELSQIHATVIGLECRRESDASSLLASGTNPSAGGPVVGPAPHERPQLLNANFLELANERRVFQPERVLEHVSSCTYLPITVQLGGFQPTQVYPFRSRGQHPYARSFGFSGGRAVIIGWPRREETFPQVLAALRLELEALGVLHKYHARRDETGRPQELDNDCFLVLGRVRRQEITAERLAEREQRLRAFMAEEPLQLVLDRACLRLVHYTDPTLPLDRSVAYPLSAVANLKVDSQHERE